MEYLVQIFSIRNIAIYLIIMNLVGFLSMLIDKKKAERGSWRIKESTLLIIAVLGGSIGSIAGMYTFRHKTQKPRFYVGLPIILITQILIIIYIVTQVNK